MCYDILVVDDDESNLELLQKHLTDTGWRVKLAHDGHEALKLLVGRCLHGHQYSQSCRMVVTDIEMPIMGGIELLKKI